MKKSIESFQEQFDYEPEIVNADKLGAFESAVIGGMGGSGLVAGILRMIKPELDIAAHHEYGLPVFLDKDDKKRLFIAISHSGNTEETLDFCKHASERGFRVAVVAAHGKLMEFAKENDVPYIDLPGDSLQPRVTLGFMLKAVLKLLGEDELLKEIGGLGEILDPDSFEDEGRKLSETLKGKVPVVYTSRRNQPIAYNWKIKFNETGKIPAFYNTFPELNHNEMTGFDVVDSTKGLSDNMHFVILKDSEDHERVLKRMDTLKKLYEDRGLPVTVVELTGKTRAERIFNSLILADWTAYHTAGIYGVESEQVPMVEEFKKAIQ